MRPLGSQNPHKILTEHAYFVELVIFQLRHFKDSQCFSPLVVVYILRLLHLTNNVARDPEGKAQRATTAWRVTTRRNFY